MYHPHRIVYHVPIVRYLPLLYIDGQNPTTKILESIFNLEQEETELDKLVEILLEFGIWNLEKQ